MGRRESLTFITILPVCAVSWNLEGVAGPRIPANKSFFLHPPEWAALEESRGKGLVSERSEWPGPERALSHEAVQ